MAANSYWQLEKEYHTLTEGHDFIIRVIEHKKITRTEGEGANQRTVTDSVATKVHDLKVKRDTLINAAEYFKKLVDGGFKESQQSIVELKEDSAESAEGVIVWLKILHGSHVKSTYSINLRGIWEVLAAAHKYGLDPKSKEGKAWFEGWYSANQSKADGKKFDFKDYQSLMFPCHTFEHARGFTVATEYLVYRATGHITERRPEGFTHDHLRLNQIIIQQLNAARGRLKTILHRGLYNTIDRLLKNASCNCKESVLYSYEKALSNTGAWPLETSYLNQSVMEILRKLGAFPHGTLVQSCGSGDCSFNFSQVVRQAVTKTREYFDGLCLDCMDASKPKIGDADEDYWRHEEDEKWDDGCRISHGQPTWYFSFMGRKEKQIKWTKSKSGRHNGN